MLLFAREQTSGDPVFMIVIILAILGLGTLLLLSIIKEYKRRKDEKISADETLGIINKKNLMVDLEDFIRVYRLSNEATVFLFELSNANELIDSFGKKNELLLREKVLSNVVKILPRNTILAEYNLENDEYAILFRGKVSRDTINQFATYLVETIERPIAVPSMEVETSYSCFLGISFYPSHAISASDLMNKADLALYMHHKMPNQRYAIFSSNFDETEKDNLIYYNEIKSAIKNKEFTIYYQPIADYQNNKIVGYEALIRWQHPQYGVLPPNKFLSVLENSGDILWVGRWTIQEICMFYTEHVDAFKEDVVFSVNLSTKQLLNEKVVQEFCDILRKYGVPTSLICVEIEEYSLYEKYKTVENTIKEFVNKGFKIAIDHLGLDSNNIKKIVGKNLYMIKMTSDDLLEAKDSFVNARMLELLIDTCKNEKIEVCTLKIENQETVDYLLQNSIKYFQGYFISAPMAADKAVEFAKSDNWKK